MHFLKYILKYIFELYFIQHVLELIELTHSVNLDGAAGGVAVLGRERKERAKGVCRASSERLVFR